MENLQAYFGASPSVNELMTPDPIRGGRAPPWRGPTPTESPLRSASCENLKNKEFVSNTMMQHATDRHATQHTRTRRTFATHSPEPTRARESRHSARLRET